MLTVSFACNCVSNVVKSSGRMSPNPFVPEIISFISVPISKSISTEISNLTSLLSRISITA